MKISIKIASLITAFILFTNTLSAQFKFGAKAGLNIANQKFSGGGEESISVGSRLGPALGFFTEYEITNNLIFQNELAFSSLGSKSSESGELVSTIANYIVLPVIVKYKISNFSLGAGPQLGILASADYKFKVAGVSTAESIKRIYKATDFSILLNSDYSISEKFVIGLRYQIGLSDFAKELPSEVNSRNNVFQFGFGYRF